MPYDSLDGEGPSNNPLSPLYNRSTGLVTWEDRLTRQQLDQAASMHCPIKSRILPTIRRTRKPRRK